MVWDCFNVILQELWAHEFSVGSVRCSLVTPYLSSRSRRFRRVAIRVRCRDVSHTTTPPNKAPWHRNMSMQNVIRQGRYYQHVYRSIHPSFYLLYVKNKEMTYLWTKLISKMTTKYIDQHTPHCSISYPCLQFAFKAAPAAFSFFFPENGNSRGTRGVAGASYCLVLPRWLKMIGTFGTEYTPKCLGKVAHLFLINGNDHDNLAQSHTTSYSIHM